MALHAVGNIDDAIDATKAFVLPFELRRWLKLAFVVFFLGGGGGTGGIQNIGNLGNIGDGGGPGGPGGGATGGFSLTAPVETLPALSDVLFQVPGPDVPADPSGALGGLGVAVVAIAVIVILAIALVFAVVGAVMEFVFTKSLITQEVHVRRSFRKHLGDGLWLLGFRIVLGILGLLVFGSILLGLFALVVGADLANLGTSVMLGSIGLVVVVIAAAALVLGTISGFTNVFVVPLMVQGDEGILAGWGRLWSSITAEPKQYLAYLFLSVVLGIGVGIVGAVLGAIAFVVLAIPFGIVGALFWFALGEGLASGVLVGIVALLFVLALLVVANLIKAPLQSFLRYYAMLVLGDIDADLDPIPEVRASIRDEA
ncbi:hypothetical protein ACFQJ5_05735 [Halomicroarcula sp. GCM10025324]|uniref:DUF7544 domain-containing protein n=1 Tax=Haloarcula TaxID=2237 RepID=UPI0023E84303|nr:hypothetical protein [Halomicroarcula sp. ZS-22-S1]